MSDDKILGAGDEVTPVGKVLITKVVDNEDGTFTIHGVDEAGQALHTTQPKGTPIPVIRRENDPRYN